MHANTWPRPDDDTWRLDAACRTLDPDLFFPAAGELDRRAIDACANCDVRDACLADAMASPSLRDFSGYRAGTTENDRYNTRRRNKRRAARQAQGAA